MANDLRSAGGPEAWADGGGARGLIKKLQQKIGELVLDLDLLKEAAKHRRLPEEPSES